MKLKKILIILLIISFEKNFSFSNESIFIKMKIDNEIITNFDLMREKNYLIALNPNLKNLEKKLQIKIAMDSIVKEIIKKNELLKYFELNQENKIIDNFVKNFYINLGFDKEEDFQNYLNERGWSLDEVRKKIEIEALWNQFIFEKYQNQMQINEKKLKDIIQNKKDNEFKILYNLSEIIFALEKNKSLEDTIDLINKSITEIGFENTANLYSISDSSKIGGKIGWIESDSLASKLNASLEKIKIGDYTDPINLNSKFFILKINDIKKEKKDLDEKKELKRLIISEQNRQLNNFSKIYFDKIRINAKINEY